MAASRDTRDERRHLALPVVVAALLVALLVGIAVGYYARGEPDAGNPVTVEGEIPSVTVTVPQAP